MDALSENSTSLDPDLSPGPGDLVLAALWHWERPTIGADLAAATPPAPRALAQPAGSPPPPTLRDRFEQLRPGHQMLVAALGAALLVAGVGWVVSGLFGTKAAALAATAATI
jgi:hypothetical protein